MAFPKALALARIMAPAPGRRGIRDESLFKCPYCNYSCSADYNGAVNIMKRTMGYMPMAGACLTQP
ncbi:MAG: transposase [Candidatus Brockarchaeota archaeon]|nr:transposase [Candidatus Brockarchaeota archaeon]